MRLASVSAGLTQGAEARKAVVASFVDKIIQIVGRARGNRGADGQEMSRGPRTENALEILGLGAPIVPGILAGLGDIDRFDVVIRLRRFRNSAMWGLWHTVPASTRGR